MSNTAGADRQIVEIAPNLQLFPFEYRARDEVFTIADVEVALGDFDPCGFKPRKFGLNRKGIDLKELPEHPALLLEIGGIVLGPKLHTLAEQNPDAIHDAADVMHAAYSNLVEQSGGSIININTAARRKDFLVRLREDGGLILQVMGNAAGIAPNPQGFVVGSQLSIGFAEYAFNNADTQTQRASLYAGIGHLAWLATEQQ